MLSHNLNCENTVYTTRILKSDAQYYFLSWTYPTFIQLCICKLFHSLLFYAVLIFTSCEGVHATQLISTSFEKSMWRTRLWYHLICNAPGLSPETLQTATRPSRDSTLCSVGFRLSYLQHLAGENLLIHLPRDSHKHTLWSFFAEYRYMNSNFNLKLFLLKQIAPKMVTHNWVR